MRSFKSTLFLVPPHLPPPRPIDPTACSHSSTTTTTATRQDLLKNTGEPRHEARSSAYEVQSDAIRDAAHNIAQHLLEQWQPFALEDPTQRKLHAIERFSSVCDRGMQFCFPEDPDAQTCVKTLSSILRDVWEIVKERSHSARCAENIGNSCLEMAKALTHGLGEWLRSAEATITDGALAVSARRITIAVVELIDADIKSVPERIGSCYKVLQKMNHIRFILCEYSLYIPRSVLLPGVQLVPNVYAIGSYADVYEGTFKGQRVAIKNFRLHSSSMSDGSSKMAKSFYREIAIQRGLSHPNICSFIGVTKDHLGGRTCLVLAWCKYANIMKFLEEKGFSPIDVYRLLIEVVDGLCYLHQEGIAHGDLHPGNVLVDEEGHIKLSDFGMSNVSDTELSIGTMWPGAMRYMAPEIHDPSRYGLNHTRHTEKSDVYSFGHLCWKIFTGIDPFYECYRGYNVTMAVLEGRLPTRPSSDGQRYICDGLWDIMQKCWQRLPEDRPSTVSLRNELRSLAYPGAPYCPVGSPTTRDDDEQSGLTRYFSMDSTVMSFVSFDDQ